MSTASTALGAVPAPTDQASTAPRRAARIESGEPGIRTRRNIARGKDRFRRIHLGAVSAAEDIVHYGVALVLVGVAAVVVFHTISTLATTREAFTQAATTAVDGVLFAIIIMEVMRTVMAHFDRGGLQLQPFLIIGIISAVREILSVGAHLSLQASGQDTPSVIHVALLELAVNGGLVLGLAGALVLIRRLAGMSEVRGESA
jgi:uncharacterized membrane protein (DUF373 family)